MTTRSTYLQLLRERVPLADVVRDTIALSEMSGYLRGECPAHSDAILSLHVHPPTRSFLCYGCGVQGDVVTWTMFVDDVEEDEAVGLLASRAGLPPPPHLS